MGKEHLGGKKVPGEGTTSDKLVLESALRRVLGTGESRPVEPMESKSLTDPIKFSDNPSLQHNETSSGITGGHGVVKRVLARVFGKLRQDTNCQMVTRSDI